MLSHRFYDAPSGEPRLKGAPTAADASSGRGSPESTSQIYKTAPTHPQRHPELDPKLQCHPEFNPKPKRHPELDPKLQRHPEFNPKPKRHPKLNPKLQGHPEFNPKPKRHPELDPKLQGHPEFNPKPKRHPGLDPGSRKNHREYRGEAAVQQNQNPTTDLLKQTQ